uniref:Phosphatidylethanolamine-binding F40A3.3 n=2 Tax=Aceria tosichella TaxID=561515 RepID=A0A6G1SG27_9ACAR
MQLITRSSMLGHNRLALVLVLGFSCIQTFTVNAKPMAEASLDNLTKEQVVSDVIDVQPAASIGVEWPSGVTAQQGNELTPTQVKDQPKFSFNAKPDKFYTLAMVDPDAPSRKDPANREILHFMVANIPGSDVSKGDTFAEYVGSGAPEKTGLHRYIFLLFEQKEKLNSDLMSIKKTSRVGRVKFSIRKFAKEHNLGDPIAANFFQAQYDDYVPKLHAQLSSG